MRRGRKEALHASPRQRSAGVAAVEFALALPLLILLALPVIDIGRGIQAQLILLNLSREGASLAARGPYSLKEESQVLMDALMSTAPPLNMSSSGMMYITRIMGKKVGAVINNVAIEQYRWTDSSYSPPSAIVACKTWAVDGSCSSLPTQALPTMAGQLGDGEVIYVVETFYRFNAIFSGLVPAWGTGMGAASTSGLTAASIF